MPNVIIYSHSENTNELLKIFKLYVKFFYIGKNELSLFQEPLPIDFYF